MLLIAGLTPPSMMAQTQDTDIRPIAKRLLETDLKLYFTGQTFDGAYNFTFATKARNKFIETHNEDRSVKYVEGELVAEGYWGIFDDNICYHYHNPDMNGGCFRVYRILNCFYFYSNRLPDDPNEIEGDFWNARSVIKGDTPECDAIFS